MASSDEEIRRLQGQIRRLYRFLIRYRFGWMLLPFASVAFGAAGFVLMGLSHLGARGSRLAGYFIIASVWSVGLLLAIFKHYARMPADDWNQIGAFRRTGRLFLGLCAAGILIAWPIWWFFHRAPR